MKIFMYKKYSLVLSMFVLLTGCEIAGLDFQKDQKYDYHVLDPKIEMNAWDYMNQRQSQDSLFNLMLKGISYAGIDPEEYRKEGRTFLLLSNTAILSKDNSGKVSANCFFGKFPVNGKPAQKWEDYSVETVRDLLLYHLIEGVYSYDNLTAENTIVTTLVAPEKNNKLYLKVMNDRNSKIRINDFVDTIKFVEVASSNIQATNGVVHVLNIFAEYGIKQ